MMRRGKLHRIGEPCECWGMAARVAYAIHFGSIPDPYVGVLTPAQETEREELSDQAEELGWFPEAHDLDGHCELCSALRLYAVQADQSPVRSYVWASDPESALEAHDPDRFTAFEIDRIPLGASVRLADVHIAGATP